MKTQIVNGQVYLEDGTFHKTNLTMEGERINYIEFTIVYYYNLLRIASEIFA